MIKAYSALGRTFELDIRYKKMKTLRLRVYPDGRVCVSAPLRTSSERIMRFVDARKEWIVSKLDAAAALPGSALCAHIADGISIRLLGAETPVKVIASDESRVFEAEDTLVFAVRDPYDTAALDALFTRWRRERARAVYLKALDFYYPVLEARGAPYPSLAIHRTTSRWGSCNKQKAAVNISCYLLRAPYECVEYVVLHELAHLLYSGHGKDFYAFIESVMPDWKARRALLSKEIPGGL